MTTKMTKTQKQIALLGGLLAAIVLVIIWVLGGGSGELAGTTYRPKTVSTELSGGIFSDAEFTRLQSPIPLPLTPGAAGRTNPFEPFR